MIIITKKINITKMLQKKRIFCCFAAIKQKQKKKGFEEQSKSR